MLIVHVTGPGYQRIFSGETEFSGGRPDLQLTDLGPKTQTASGEYARKTQSLKN